MLLSFALAALPLLLVVSSSTVDYLCRIAFGDRLDADSLKSSLHTALREKQARLHTVVFMDGDSMQEVNEAYTGKTLPELILGKYESSAVLQTIGNHILALNRRIPPKFILDDSVLDFSTQLFLETTSLKRDDVLKHDNFDDPEATFLGRISQLRGQRLLIQVELQRFQAVTREAQGFCQNIQKSSFTHGRLCEANHLARSFATLLPGTICQIQAMERSMLCVRLRDGFMKRLHGALRPDAPSNVGILFSSGSQALDRLYSDRLALHQRFLEWAVTNIPALWHQYAMLVSWTPQKPFTLAKFRERPCVPNNLVGASPELLMRCSLEIGGYMFDTLANMEVTSMSKKVAIIIKTLLQLDQKSSVFYDSLMALVLYLTSHELRIVMSSDKDLQRFQEADWLCLAVIDQAHRSLIVGPGQSV
jgi:hypothetical protein